jgi:hypothetical protein
MRALCGERPFKFYFASATTSSRPVTGKKRCAFSTKMHTGAFGAKRWNRRARGPAENQGTGGDQLPAGSDHGAFLAKPDSPLDLVRRIQDVLNGNNEPVGRIMK